MTDIHTFIFENIPLCFSKHIKIKGNILKGNMDKKYFGFQLSNISVINNDKTFNLEVSGTEKELETTKYWMFRYFRYLYKTKYPSNNHRNLS
tara:strand:+ start:109 stop:384 length:276 start_codon:yes stop_codon:yes gene_type:complete